MPMSACLKQFLDQHHVPYDLVPHRPTDTAFNAARSAHVPTECMVKGVLLRDEAGYVMAAVPCTRSLDLELIYRYTGRRLSLAQESELQTVLEDCQTGAVPALGEAFGLATVWDQHLVFQPSFYIEAGDHEELVRLSHFAFMDLVAPQHGAPITH